MHKDPMIRTGLQFSWPVNKGHSGQRRVHWDAANHAEEDRGRQRGQRRAFPSNAYLVDGNLLKI